MVLIFKTISHRIYLLDLEGVSSISLYKIFTQIPGSWWEQGAHHLMDRAQLLEK